VVAHEHLGSALLQIGNYDEAVSEFRKAAHIAEDDIGLRASLGHALAVTGRREEAEEIVAELLEASSQRYVSPYFMVELQAGLGNTNLAFEWLERCYTDRAPHMIFLAVEPKLDTLRADPRFSQLIRRMGLKTLSESGRTGA
jgi:tetratricopeptide (TPR) repeat protein